MQEELDRILVPVFIREVTVYKLLELFVPLFFYQLSEDDPGTSLDGHGNKAWEESGTVSGTQEVLTRC